MFAITTLGFLEDLKIVFRFSILFWIFLLYALEVHDRCR